MPNKNIEMQGIVALWSCGQHFAIFTSLQHVSMNIETEKLIKFYDLLCLHEDDLQPVSSVFRRSHPSRKTRSAVSIYFFHSIARRCLWGNDFFPQFANISYDSDSVHRASLCVKCAKTGISALPLNISMRSPHEKIEISHSQFSDALNKCHRRSIKLERNYIRSR